jgi:plasmid stability protein
MAAITLKDISDPLLDRIREQAARDKRSINREILWLLERAVSGIPQDPAMRAIQQRDAQLAVWQKLAGRWQGGIAETDTLIADIYQSRTAGREFSL